jgi:intracellular sulfur oxidation DsrE/DsrF family protein
MAGLSTIASTKHEAGSARPSWRTRSFSAAFAFVLSLVAGAAGANDDVEALLARSEAPDGVVFEIVEADESALDELLPKVRAAIIRIRAAFPQTEFAVVSHGREEFALQTQYQVENAEIHQQVQALVAEDVPVHVCETHAGWYGVSPEDFPDYVDVAPTGPGQVDLYQELGYDLIVID